MTKTEIVSITERYLGRDASYADQTAFFEVFGYRSPVGDADVRAYNAYRQLGWPWPFDVPEGV